MRRVELAAGQSITEPGLYYMNVGTGKLEGWLMPPFDPQRPVRWLQTTADHRWLTFAYDQERISVTPGPNRFLLQPRVWQTAGGATFTLVDGEMELISTFVIDPGTPGSVDFLFSDDGARLAAADSSPGGGLFLRVAGGSDPHWLAGGAGVVVETSPGRQLLSRTGELALLPDAPKPSWRPNQWYLPSPDRPDLFLTGTKVIDRSGPLIQAAQIAEGAHARAISAGWGPASREVQILFTPPLGKGFELEPWIHFLPSLQRPPFPDKHPLEVRDPLGECLNLRAEPPREARSLRCLPTGTRLSIAVKPNQYVRTSWNEQIPLVGGRDGGGRAGLGGHQHRKHCVR